MIEHTKHKLSNGLTLLLNADPNTKIVAVNTLFKVGARDEKADKTGFAHLFEHLMFEGSKHVPHFDKELQKVGGSSNAFTNNDYTNYYCTLPLDSLETALWIESDRMLHLDLSEKNLENQKSVVSEEFKQRYLNQPYGDIWFLVREMMYKNHPYMWPTIGKDLSHIEKAKMEDVKSFFSSYYSPSNAILTISGDIDIHNTITQVEKWYKDIPSGNINTNIYPDEPVQTEQRFLQVDRDVPQNILLKAYLMPERTHEDYYVYDVISELLSGGKTAILYNELVKKAPVFSDISAFVSSNLSKGMFVISGRLAEGVSIEDANKKLNDLLVQFKNNLVAQKELEKCLNNVLFAHSINSMGVLNKAMNLSYFEMIGGAELFNDELNKYQKVTAQQVSEIANKLFVESRENLLYYLKK
jgi:zinc protease